MDCNFGITTVDFSFNNDRSLVLSRPRSLTTVLIMADSVGRLVRAKTFSSLQEELETWSKNYHVRTITVLFMFIYVIKI